MNYKQSQQERSHMKLKHPKLATACAVLAMLIIAILFLPVIPFSSPGTMGGGSSSVMDHIITPYPPNQPDSLPVYRVTDYVDIVDDTTKIYDYDKDPYNYDFFADVFSILYSVPDFIHVQLVIRCFSSSTLTAVSHITISSVVFVDGVLSLSCKY